MQHKLREEVVGVKFWKGLQKRRAAMDTVRISLYYTTRLVPHPPTRGAKKCLVSNTFAHSVVPSLVPLPRSFVHSGCALLTGSPLAGQRSYLGRPVRLLHTLNTHNLLHAASMSLCSS